MCCCGENNKEARKSINNNNYSPQIIKTSQELLGSVKEGNGRSDYLYHGFTLSGWCNVHLADSTRALQQNMKKDNLQ